eukprot:TRINITY_DN12789_c0_g1_i2.p1 TRINITY_DN12789_c0_g1~~TRINITY_DN12789_c0_g1_i2.p1  ORF type:complete len:234 (-),score=52.50 TRINITY_DN12789_c0_g1_i2:64-765(-)
MSVAAPVRVGISAALPRVGAAVRAATNAADSTKASVQYQIAVPGEVVLAKAIIESRQGGVSGTVQRLEEDEDWTTQPPLTEEVVTLLKSKVSSQPPLTEDVVQLLNSNVRGADLPQVDVLNRRHTADEINEAIRQAIIESRQGEVSGTVQRLEEDEDWAVQPPLTEDVVQLLNSNVSSADLPQVDVLNRRHTADEINEAIRQEVMSRPAPISVWPTEEEEADFWCDWKKQVIY